MIEARAVTRAAIRDRAAGAILDEQFEASAYLQPSGRHLLEVRGAIGTVSFTADQLPRLEAAIADFKAEVAFEDGRTVERQRPHRVELAGRRR